MRPRDLHNLPAMASETELRHAISLRPSPFHHNPPSRDNAAVTAGPSGSGSDHHHQHQQRRGLYRAETSPATVPTFAHLAAAPPAAAAPAAPAPAPAATAPEYPELTPSVSVPSTVLGASNRHAATASAEAPFKATTGGLGSNNGGGGGGGDDGEAEAQVVIGIPPHDGPVDEKQQARSTAWEGLGGAPDEGGVAARSTMATRRAAAVSALSSAAASEGDLESQAYPGYDGRDSRYNTYTDPYRLSAGIKSEEEISRIKANSSRKRGAGAASRVSKTLCAPIAIATSRGDGKTTDRKLQGFYREQNENIERLLKPVDDHRREAKDTYGENELRYKIAVHGSFIANVLLAGLQVYAAASSKSLALFTTMADALFDPLSNLSLIISHRAINRVDGRRFPSGKARIETAANIAFCFIMTAVSLIIIVQSIRDLIEGSTTRTTQFHLASVIAVAVAFTTKLGLFTYCFAIRNLYSQIRILWEDHRNDLIINGTGLMFSLLGSYVRWWIDPAGAIMISLLIIFLWLRTAHSEFLLLIGVTAEPDMLRHITYISMTHSDQVKAIDTVRAYYSGPRLIVEVDIVMDADETLRATHDLAEDLQMKLERLPSVERAYVHVDYETSHAPEHFLKKEL